MDFPPPLGRAYIAYIYLLAHQPAGPCGSAHTLYISEGDFPERAVAYSRDSLCYGSALYSQEQKISVL